MKIQDFYKSETGYDAFHFSFIGQKLYSDGYISWLENRVAYNEPTIFKPDITDKIDTIDHIPIVGNMV